MKRRKLIGLVLIIATFVYFIACLLATYQNQRVKIEKEMGDALKAYSSQEANNIKELSEDFSLRLNEKMDEKEGKQQILKFEGSFDRMEKNITNVTNEMALVEYNIRNLSDRLNIIENYKNELQIELSSKFDMYDDELNKINQSTLEIHNNILEIEELIAIMESTISSNDKKQSENIETVQMQLDELKVKFVELVSNALLYKYDQETETLYVYGDKGENENKQED